MSQRPPRRRRPRQVDIFNFSFLDILACTIGLLIFIMVMVFILQSAGSLADAKAIVQQKLAEARSLQNESAETDAIAASLANQLASIPDPYNPALVSQRNSEMARYRASQREYARTLASLEQSQQSLATLQSRLATSHLAARIAANHHIQNLLSQIATAQQQVHAAIAHAPKSHLHFAPTDLPATLHAAIGRDGLLRVEDAHKKIAWTAMLVECRRPSLVVLHLGPHGVATGQSYTSTAGIIQPTSPYAIALRRLAQSPHPLVIFWVRPDAIAAFNLARSAVPSGISIGYEPADPAWKILPARPEANDGN